MELLDDAPPVDVFLMPPDDDNNTDEDSDDEEDVMPKDPNHLGKGVLSQKAELLIYETADVEEEASIL